MSDGSPMESLDTIREVESELEHSVGTGFTFASSGFQSLSRDRVKKEVYVETKNIVASLNLPDITPLKTKEVIILNRREVNGREYSLGNNQHFNHQLGPSEHHQSSDHETKSEHHHLNSGSPRLNLQLFDNPCKVSDKTETSRSLSTATPQHTAASSHGSYKTESESGNFQTIHGIMSHTTNHNSRRSNHGRLERHQATDSDDGLPRSTDYFELLSTVVTDLQVNKSGFITDITLDAELQISSLGNVEAVIPLSYLDIIKVETINLKPMLSVAAEERRLREEQEARIAAEERKRREEEVRAAAEERRLREEQEARIAAEERKRREEEVRAAAEERRLREEQEARIAAEERKRREEEVRAAAEERRLREEQEARIAAEERKRREEEVRAGAEQRRLREEQEARIAAEERKRREEEVRAAAEERRLREEQEARIAAEERKRREEEVRAAAEQRRLREEQEARIAAEERKRREEEVRAAAELGRKRREEESVSEKFKSQLTMFENMAQKNGAFGTVESQNYYIKRHHYVPASHHKPHATEYKVVGSHVNTKETVYKPTKFDVDETPILGQNATSGKKAYWVSASAASNVKEFDRLSKAKYELKQTTVEPRQIGVFSSKKDTVFDDNKTADNSHKLFQSKAFAHRRQELQIDALPPVSPTPLTNYFVTTSGSTDLLSPESFEISRINEARSKTNGSTIYSVMKKTSSTSNGNPYEGDSYVSQYSNKGTSYSFTAETPEKQSVTKESENQPTKTYVQHSLSENQLQRTGGKYVIEHDSSIIHSYRIDK